MLICFSPREGSLSPRSRFESKGSGSPCLVVLPRPNSPSDEPRESKREHGVWRKVSGRYTGHSVWIGRYRASRVEVVFSLWQVGYRDCNRLRWRSVPTNVNRDIHPVRRPYFTVPTPPHSLLMFGWSDRFIKERHIGFYQYVPSGTRLHHWRRKGASLTQGCPVPSCSSFKMSPIKKVLPNRVISYLRKKKN